MKLTRDQFQEFPAGTSGKKSFAIKVILKFGISGSSRCIQLMTIKTEGIENALDSYF